MEWWPSLGVTPALAAYAGIAIVMVAIQIYLLFELLPRRGGPPTLSRVVGLTSAMIGTSAFLLSLIGLVFAPASTTATIVVLLSLNFMMFAPPGLWIIAVLVYHDRRIDAASWWWPVLITSAAATAEALMGLLFSVSDPVPRLDAPALSLALTSPWFDWSMVAAMTALLIWVPISRPEREALATLSAAGLVAPWVAALPLLGAVLMSAVMGCAFVVLFRGLARAGSLDRGALRLVVGVVAGFSVMTASEWINLLIGGTPGLLTFGAVTLLVMGADLAYLCRRAFHLSTGSEREGPSLPTRALSPDGAASRTDTPG
ncbi:MAG: hypothetical protein ACREDK_02225 [Thermoplasmata archaeon]